MRSPQHSTAFGLQLCILSFLGMTACGGAQTNTNYRPVNFSYTLKNSPHQLAELRGKPTLLILMRTSEMVSQIYMERFSAAYQDIKDTCHILVLTVEATETPFVDAYRDIQKMPVDIGTAEPSVLPGNSSLGIIPFIPYTYFIDTEGNIVFHAPGVIETTDLIDLVGRNFER